MAALRRGTPSPEPGVYPIESGELELVRDEHRPNAWIVNINGVMSSHIDLDDPGHLDFEYMRWMGDFFESVFEREQALRFTHLGGGACTMARYALTVFPHSTQVVAEIDGELARRAREWFALPRAPKLRIRNQDALEVLEQLHEGSADVIIRDVFAGSRTPEHLVGRSSAISAARALLPGGFYVLNSGDDARLSHVKREARTLASVFGSVIAIADPAMFKGRRSGNVIFVASAGEVPLSAALERQLRSRPIPAKVLAGAELEQWSRGAIPYP